MVLPSRFFKNKFRWLGLILAVTSVAILSSANISTQWVGWSLSVGACIMWVWWSLSVAACVMWVWFGYKDKDWPRMIMECMYMILSIRAVFNWLGF